MGFTAEYESSVAAPRMFKAAVLDWHNLGPKVVPDIIASGSIVHGTSGIGTVRQINFTEAVMPFNYVKERLDFVYKENMEAKWTIREGGHLTTTLDGGIGTVRQISLTEVMPFNYVKERLDFVDKENMEAKWTIIEGGQLTTTMDGATAHYKMQPTTAGGCMCRVVTETRIKTGVGAHTSDEVAKAKEGMTKQFKATEAFQLANPVAHV